MVFSENGLRQSDHHKKRCFELLPELFIEPQPVRWAAPRKKIGYDTNINNSLITQKNKVNIGK
jgi:hypothetical protein